MTLQEEKLKHKLNVMIVINVLLFIFVVASLLCAFYTYKEYVKANDEAVIHCHINNMMIDFFNDVGETLGSETIDKFECNDFIDKSTERLFYNEFDSGLLD